MKLKKNMKNLILLMIAISISSCAEESCISCIAQNKNNKTIVASKAACSESVAYLSGFEDGFQKRFENQLDSIEVICD